MVLASPLATKAPKSPTKLPGDSIISPENGRLDYFEAPARPPPSLPSQGPDVYTRRG